MKNIFFYFATLLFFALTTNSCKDEAIDSVAKPIILPFIAEKLMADSYVYGLGQETLQADLPNVVAIAVDTVYGMVGGHGGKTGFDSVDILKSGVLALPDLTVIGGSSISFEKYNKGGYKVSTSSNIVIAGPIANPGPTALEGNYARLSATTGAPTGYILEVKKVFNGVYIIGNPGGAASVAFLPYLLYNYANSSGTDSLAFPIQTDLCGGGLRLVSPAAAGGLTAGEYDAFPPSLTLGPNTLKWKVFEFPSANNSAVHPNEALCNWGLGLRIFEKQ